MAVSAPGPGRSVTSPRTEGQGQQGGHIEVVGSRLRDLCFSKPGCQMP
jgi:hypothetical protein